MKSNLRGSKDFRAGLLFLAIGAGRWSSRACILSAWRCLWGQEYSPTVLGLVQFSVFLMARRPMP